MPSDFDFDDVDLDGVAKKPVEPQPEPQPEAQPERVVVPMSFYDSEEEEDEPDELTVRMTKAQYYWALVNARLLEEEDDLAAEVEQEIQDFVRLRLSELVGASAPKKRGRPAKAAPKSTPKLTSRPPPVRARPLVKSLGAVSRPAKSNAQESGATSGATFTGHELVREIETQDGQKIKKIYKKMVDKESGKEYYVCYDLRDGVQVGDGLKYEMTTNTSGGTYFRTINQQTVLTTPAKISKEQFEAQFQAQAQAHSAATLGAIGKSAFGNVLSSAIELAKRS